MFWSWWNKNLSYEETVNKHSDSVFANLTDYYRENIKNGSLESDSNKMKIKYNRGNIIFSSCGIGSELWAKHFVIAQIKTLSDETTSISWDIDLKFFGFQVGKNAIIEECKKLCNEIV